MSRLIDILTTLEDIANFQLRRGNLRSYYWTKYKIEKVIHEYNKQA